MERQGETIIVPLHYFVYGILETTIIIEKKRIILLINFKHNLKQCNFVPPEAAYSYMQRTLFQIKIPHRAILACLHTHTQLEVSTNV